MEQVEVRAAGGVVCRRADGRVQIAVVHRPRHDDWSLPKGKLEPGESWEHCALREVREEIGMSCRLGQELPSTRYRDGRGRPKLARYWLMEPIAGSFTPHPEIDDVRWLAPEEAMDVLSYEHDVELIRASQAAIAASAGQGDARC